MGHGHASSPRSWRRAVALRAGACARGCCYSTPNCALRAHRERDTQRWRALELKLLLLLLLLLRRCCCHCRLVLLCPACSPARRPTGLD